MATATFTTEQGTEIRLSNAASPIAIEILKTIVPVIEIGRAHV